MKIFSTKMNTLTQYQWRASINKPYYDALVVF